MGNSLGKCQNSGSTTSNQPREKEQACSNKVMEYSRTDILPTRSSSVAKGYNEAGLPNDNLNTLNS